MARDDHGRSLSFFHEAAVLVGSMGKGVFGGVPGGSKNALEVLSQHLHSLDVENKIASLLAMGMI